MTWRFSAIFVAHEGRLQDGARGQPVSFGGHMNSVEPLSAGWHGRFMRAAARTIRPLRMRFVVRHLGAMLGVVAASLLVVNATQDANANGETRSLTMHHAHTNELLTITYKRNGSFEQGALEKLNWFLRDWRVDEPTSMSPQLFDVIWYVYREVGANEPIKIMSAYRSPGTNAMLRRRSRAVAKESQHMRGNAMDVHIPGVSMSKVRELGMRLQRGGVGYYPSAGSPFVHLDIGSVRSWPRMPREQLERLFPDGKTVHLPADGIPLANYQAALAEVQARGGSALDYETVTTNRGKSLWALLFGGDEDEDSSQPVAGGRNARVAAVRGRGAAPEQVAALSTTDNPMSTAAVGFAPGARSVRPVPVTVSPVPTTSDVEAPAAAPVPARGEPAKSEPVKAEPVKAEPMLQIAALPVPPIRPRGPQFDKLVAAAEPLPPIRPAGLTTLVASLSPNAPASPVVAPGVAEIPPASPPLSAVPGMAMVSGIPLPPVRPAAPVVVAAVSPPAIPPQGDAALPSVTMPLPPMRPALAVAAPPMATLQTAVAGSSPQALPGIVSRPDAPENAAGLAQAYAPIAAPLPPSRPGPARQPTTVAALAPSPPASSPAAPAIAARPATNTRATNPGALVAARPAAQTRPAQVSAVTEPPVEREVRSSVVAMRFSIAPGGAVAGTGFGGAFIRPLGASFTRAGE